MELSWGVLIGLGQRTLRDPRAGARAVMDLRLPLPVMWTALALTAVMSAILLHVSFALLTPAERGMVPLLPGPFESVVLQSAVIVVTALLAHYLGRMRGGQGSFPEALILMIWLQAILLAFQALQIVALVALPAVTDLIGLLVLGVFMWLLTAFVAELHRFSSMGKVFLGIVGAILAVAMVLSLLLRPFLGAGG